MLGTIWELSGVRMETPKEYHRRVAMYLDCLRMVPSDVFLAVCLRDFDMSTSNLCVCGWVVREALARFRNVDADEVTPFSDNSANDAYKFFGGDAGAWNKLFRDVTAPDYLPGVEEAFVTRLDEILAPVKT